VGEHTVTVQVKDLAAATDDQSYQLTVDNENDPPVVSAIPDQTIDEGQLFNQIILDNYVHDPDNSPQDMQWTASGNNKLQVTINSERIATITAPDSNWYGSEQIIFTARDPGGLSDRDSAVFTVRAVNDPPLISTIPGQEISEGGHFTEIHLDNFVQDADDADEALTWSASGNVQLEVTIDANRVARISVTDAEWNGSENIIFTVQDPEGLSDKDTALFTVLAVNDPPRFTPPLPAIVSATALPRPPIMLWSSAVSRAPHFFAYFRTSFSSNGFIEARLTTAASIFFCCISIPAILSVKTVAGILF
jgi:hypothetical protein